MTWAPENFFTSVSRPIPQKSKQPWSQDYSDAFPLRARARVLKTPVVRTPRWRSCSRYGPSVSGVEAGVLGNTIPNGWRTFGGWWRPGGSCLSIVERSGGRLSSRPSGILMVVGLYGARWDRGENAKRGTIFLSRTSEREFSNCLETREGIHELVERKKS